MADEKILEAELLDDAELENVAGGTNKETDLDANQLNKMGLLDFPNPARFRLMYSMAVAKVPGIIEGLGKELGLDIQYKSNAKGNNEYIIDGQSFSRKEFWAIVDEARAANSKRVYLW